MTNALDISRCMFIDFETIATNRQRILDFIASQMKHPSTMTKLETIEVWRVEKLPDALAEAIAKTALDGGTGRLASLAFGIGDNPIVSVTTAKPADGETPAGYDADLERKVIVRFFGAWQRCCDENGGRAPTLVGHNVSGFDIRWLWKRAIVLGIEPPASWPITAKPWETDRVFDTMVVWEGVGGRISQDRLALALDLPTKYDFDGSMVGEAWRAGEFEKIRQYNAADVETVRAIWKRITGYREPVEVADEEAQESVAAVVETAEERDAVIAEAVRTSQNAGNFRPGFRPGHVAQSGAAA